MMMKWSISVALAFWMASETWGASDSTPPLPTGAPSGAAGSSDDHAEWAILFDRAKTGDAESLVEIGDRLHTGRRVKPDPVKAMEYWTQAALRGHAGAKRRIAQMLLNGRVVAANSEKAMSLLRQAAGQGDIPSMLILADRYSAGHGVEPDAAEAVRWLKTGAELDNLECRMRLAWHMEHGSGVVRNRESAWALYRKCAAEGHAPAWNRLGIMHAEGIGRGKDPVEAYRCFARAARLGLEEAGQNMKFIESNASFLERRRMRKAAEEIIGPAPDAGAAGTGES